ncbi:TRIP13 [Mytilus coruscus]|uniref:TRIP13 n=1 Tax=Mytilus coruscus TaxID=42192 RepID=A0A6J8DGA7_MYTCO|nr:TRIP13 [Mytilus coruscus]
MYLLRKLCFQSFEDITTKLQETINSSFEKVSDKIKSSVENTFGDYFQKINLTKLSEGYLVAQVEAHGSENTFVETDIINIGISCLNGKGVTVLVGPPGTGKTRNSLELLRKYTEQHTDFGMIQLHETSLFSKLIRSDDRLVVLFDDVFGKTNCCFNEDVHMKDLDIVYSYVKRGFIKVILTMRNTIKKMCEHTISKHRLFEKSNLLDLALQSHQMNPHQKMECLRKYCAKFNVLETELTAVKGDKSMEIATLSTTQICEIAGVDNNPFWVFQNLAIYLHQILCL